MAAAATSAGAVLDLGPVPLPLSAEGLFGDPRPLEVELGCGKGRFAVEWAASHPERGLVTVERARVYLEKTVARAARFTDRPSASYAVVKHEFCFGPLR